MTENIFLKWFQMTMMCEHICIQNSQNCWHTTMQINCPRLYCLMYISLAFSHNHLSLQNKDKKKPTEIKCCAKCLCLYRCQLHFRPSFRLSSCLLKLNSTQSSIHFNFHVKSHTVEGKGESKLMRKPWEHLPCH